MGGISRWSKRLLYLLPAPLALLALRVCARHPEMVEAWFSRRLYPIWATRLSQLAGLFESALAEKLSITFIVCAGAMLLIRAVQSILGFSARPLLRCLYRLICVSGALYAVFVLSWGLHFARVPFADATDLQLRPTSKTELSALCNILLKDALALRAQAQEDGRGAFALSDTLDDLLANVSDAYGALAGAYPFLAGNYAPPKRAALGEAFSEMRIMGIYIPFTGEALLNPGIPASQLAHTAAHEAAHQRGIAREAEADFVAYLACIASDDPSIAYSGTLTMLRYAALSLSEIDPEAYHALCARFSAGIAQDYAQQIDYWKRFDTTVAGLVNLTNERYLQTFAFKTSATDQRDDLVALLLAYYR
ncbi:MAG: DUF3810 domain-containing protein [Clostridia bacterium]|nr:DUF3810 domain-containing protein [Clostridia bacterium]